MSAADEAYKAAEAEIERVIAAGEDRLDLSGEAFRALEVLPEVIRKATKVISLKLDETQVSDLAQVSGLTNLLGMSAIKTKIADLFALSDLTKIQELHLSDTHLADVSVLAGLANLKVLYLNGTRVIDLSALSGLYGLRELYLSDTRVADVSALSSLLGLQVLYLNHTQVDDVSGLASLTGLKELYLSRTKVADVSALSRLVNLNALYLSGTQVVDVTALSNLTELQVLYLNYTQIADISALLNLKALKRLNLIETLVFDMRPLTALSDLISNQGEFRMFSGLHFRDTPATSVDAELMRLSEIKDDDDRTKRVFAYLDGLKEWPPGGVGVVDEIVPEEPEQEPVLRVALVGEQVEVLAAAQEGQPQDRVAQKALEKLRVAVERLAVAAGNVHFGLSTDARHFAKMLEAALADLDLIDVYDELERFREILESRADRVGEDVLSADEVQALRDIGRNGPILVMPDGEVQIAMQRHATYYAQSQEPAIAEARQKLSATIRADEALFGPRLRRYQEEGGSERNAVTRFVTVKNAAIAVVGLVASGVAASAGGDLYQLVIGWMAANAAWIFAIMDSIGISAVAWAAPVLTQAREAWDAMKALGQTEK